MATTKTASGGDGFRAGGCILAVLGCAFFWTATVSFDVADWPSRKVAPHNESIQNACGRVGAWLAYTFFEYFGPGTFVLAACLTVWTVVWIARGRVERIWQRVVGAVLLVAVTSVSAYMLSQRVAAGLPIEHGGVLGIALGNYLAENFHWAGTLLILIYCVIMGGMFAAEEVAAPLPGLLWRAGRDSGSALGTGGVGMLARLGERLRRPAPEKPAARPELKVKTARSALAEATAAGAAAAPAKGEKPSAGTVQPELFNEKTATIDPPKTAGSREAREYRVNTPTTKAKAAGQEKAARAGGAATAPIVPMVAPAASAVPSKAAQEDRVVPQPYPQALGEWELPSTQFLDEPEYKYAQQQEALVREQAALLEQTLEDYRVDAQVVEIDTGPVISMFELNVAAGVKVSQISSLSNDIARALKAPAVRVVAPIPGKNTIGIEVPNLDKERVRLKELLTLGQRQGGEMTLPLFLGKDASGNPLVCDLTKMPHMLIAGTTGSGKSVCINSIVMSILMTQRPDMVKMILIDPKMVELNHFRDIPHLMCPIVTETARAEAILEWAVQKMDERYALLAEAGVRNIHAYNRLTRAELDERFKPTTEEERTQIPTHLPYVVIIIDELADLMMTSAKEVEFCLARLAQKSRAVGIHIVVATQRPEAKVVTGLIKSNLPCRVAFRVSSRMDSRIVMDQNGAEVLMGQGDMLFLPPGSAKLVRAQGTFVEDKELNRVLEFLRQRGKPEFHPELMKIKQGDAVDDGPRDELFDEAVKIIIESGRGSVSLLQRRLMVGYSRASRLIEQMGMAGIVGEYKGSVAREVVVTLEEWEAMRAARDAAEAQGAQQEMAFASSAAGDEDDDEEYIEEPDEDEGDEDLDEDEEEDDDDGNGFDEDEEEEEEEEL